MLQIRERLVACYICSNSPDITNFPRNCSPKILNVNLVVSKVLHTLTL